MKNAYVSAGSNLGDREDNLRFALSCLEREDAVKKISPCFETEPIGYEHQPWFLNIAIEIETSRTPLELLDLCQSIEESCGRVRTFPNAPRTLDLDILLYGGEVIRDERLIIPHPRLQERRFVLEPLSRIAPNLIHPVIRKPVRVLLEQCPDRSEVRLFQ